ncbi:MAG: hypothetical protein WC747_00565 [Candidatus Babeliales bacterium]
MHPSNTTTLTSVTIKYSTSDEPTKIKTITASGLTASIAAKSTLSFRPKLIIPTSSAAVSASFIGVSELGINNKPLKLAKVWTGLDSDKISVTIKKGAPKIATKAEIKAYKEKNAATASTKTDDKLAKPTSPNPSTIENLAASMVNTKKIKSSAANKTKITKTNKKSKTGKASAKAIKTTTAAKPTAQVA